MRRRLVVLATALAAAILGARAPLAAQMLPTSQACVTCHRDLQDSTLSLPARTFQQDVHAQKGLGCLDCHGGPRTAQVGGGAADPQHGFLSRPERRDIPALCGRCHSDADVMRKYDPSLRVDQVTEYRTSVHGQRLFEDNDSNVAVCTSCHPAHRIRPPSDPESTVYPTRVADTCGQCHQDKALMDRYGIPSDQVSEWKKGVHGQQMLEKEDVSAPTCNDCHGNHGARPPGASSVVAVCGTCHSVMEDHFNASGHAKIFDQAGLPGCVTCHGNHDIEKPSEAFLADRAQAVCSRCHEPGDSATAQFLVMERVLDSLKTEEALSKAALDEAENAGMEVSQALFDLQDVTDALTKARGAIHSFRADTVRAEAGAGFKLTSEGLTRAKEAMAEHRFRRVGLAVSVGFILIVITGLLLRIRELGDPRTPEET